MTFAQERIAEVWDEAMPLIEANAREAGVGLMPFVLNKATFLTLEAAGIVRLYTARLDGKLVGYGLFLLSFHPQYATTKMATQEVIYMDPQHRGIRAAKFLHYTEAQLKADGAQVVMRHVRIGAADYSRTLQRMGYEPVQVAYLKKV